MIKPLFLRSNYLYVFGLMVLVTGLPLSLFLISISQFILAGSFFLEGNFLNKFKRFFDNKAAMLIAGIWLMHVIGLLWTTDLAQGWNDIRIKLPLLVLTIIMAGSEAISKKQFYLVLLTFIAAVFIGTMVSTGVLTGLIQREVNDIRDVFIFKISHIRFGLFTCLAVFSLIYFLYTKELALNRFYKIIFALMAFWFVMFMIIVEALTGLIITLLILTMLIIFINWKRSSTALKISMITGVLLLPLILFVFAEKTYHQHYSPQPLQIDVEARTEQGNPYTFNLKDPGVENGYPVYVYMCDEELRRTWNMRSDYDFDGQDKKMQLVKYTIIRFLASKGLRKDSAALSQLTDEEIRSIEKGIPNVLYQTPSIKVRLMQIMWEFHQYANGGDPNGHSIMQRLESWKASAGVIRSNPALGVGTGDLPFEVNKQYSIMNSRLDKNHYLRAHNQYLAIAAAFGLAGLFYFLYALGYPLRSAVNRNYFFIIFFLTAAISMLTEDTLETQPGATFFAFFNALFLFAKPKKK